MSTPAVASGRPAPSSRPGLGAPESGHRASGQLPTADADLWESQPLGRTPALRTAWWYTASGLVLLALILAVVPILPLVLRASGVDGPDGGTSGGPALVLIALCLAAGAGLVWGTLRLRDAPVDPVDWPDRRLLAALLAPGLALAAAGVVVAPEAGVAPWLVGPLWGGLLLAAELCPRWGRTGVRTGGAVAVAGLDAAIMARTEAGPADAVVGVAVMLAAVALGTLPTVWFWRVMLRLEAARRQAGGLAVARERLRFAADLHDVQGHHLQVIALKAELAERLLQRGRTDEAAAALREVREQAAEALGETRALVRGLRDVSLDDELENAAEVLRAAGAEVTVRITDPAPVLAPAVARLLGLAVREATTNALRHADPRRAEIALASGPDGVRLTVTNDGLPAAPAGPAPDPDALPGSGLASLAERAAAVGGVVTARRAGARFTTTITVPSGAREEHA